MLDNNHLITPEHHQLWTVVGFILAMLALVLALIGWYRTSTVAVMSQAQVLVINQKLEALTDRLSKGLPQSAPAALKP